MCACVRIYVCIMILLSPRKNSNHETSSIISQVLPYQVNVLVAHQVYQYQVLGINIKYRILVVNIKYLALSISG